MEGGRIRLQSDDGNLELEILEETVVSGINYILVTDAPEGEDGTCYVMKDISAPEDEDADYVFAEGDEAESFGGRRHQYREVKFWKGKQ